MRTLYLCYFGVNEPLVQTQVLPYLRCLAGSGLDVVLLTFEVDRAYTGNRAEAGAVRERLEADGIEWHSLAYHKSPSLPATLFDIGAGVAKAARLARGRRLDVLHARAHIPLAMALLARGVTRSRVLFDIRGLMADEYADSGVWVEGSPVFRTIKWLEGVGVRRADQLVVLTRKMRDWLVSNGLSAPDRVEVIPCCVDMARYSAAAAPAARSERFEIVYAGSVSGLYLLEEMGQFVAALRDARPDTFFRVLTKGSPGEAGAILERAGLRPGEYSVSFAPTADVPSFLSLASAGISFRKATFSQMAASPTKIPEYLAAGIPVVCNAGIGDVDALLADERVGVSVRPFERSALRAAADDLLALAADPGIAERCRRVATECFDLARVGGERYRRVYDRLDARRA